MYQKKVYWLIVVSRYIRFNALIELMSIFITYGSDCDVMNINEQTRFLNFSTLMLQLEFGMIYFLLYMVDIDFAF